MRDDGPERVVDLSALADLDERVDRQTAELFAQALAAEAESPQQGIRAWGQVARKTRRYRTPHRSLARLYAEAGRWSPMAEELKKELALVTDTVEQLALLRVLVVIYRDHLKLDMMVIKFLDRIRELDPDDPQVLDELAAQYERMSRWSDLVRVLRERTDRSLAVEEKIATWHHLARLHLDRFNSTPDAIAAYERVLELDPRDPLALERLESLYRRTRDRKGLAGLWQRQVEHADSASRKAQLYRLIGEAHAAGGEDLDLAIEAYQSALGLEIGDLATMQALDRLYQLTERPAVAATRVRIDTPDGADPDAFAALQRIYQEGGHWQALIDLLETRAKYTDEIDEKVDLLVKQARVYSDQFGHLDLAISALNLALEIEPGNLLAIETGARLFRMTGDLEAAEKLLESGARRIADPLKSVELLLARADLLESRLGEPRRAIEVYREVLQLDPGRTDALVALERLYQETANWQALIEVLRRRSELASDAEQVLEIACRMGQIYEKRLDDPGAALEVYQQVLDTAPKNLCTLRALAELYERTDQIETYIDLLEKQLDACSSDGERGMIYGLMASVWETKLERVDRAIACLERALQIDDGSEASHRELRRLYRLAGRHDELVDLLWRRINAATEASRRCELLIELGQVYEGPLADPQRAKELYLQILSTDGEDARALEALARLHEASGDHRQAAEALGRLSSVLEQGARRADVRYRLGCIHEQHLADPGAARARFEEALRDDPGHAGAMTRMVEINKQQGEWSAATSLLLRLEAVTSDGRRRASLLCEAGELYLQRLGDEAAGEELLRRALQLEPDNIRAAELLEPIYTRDGRHEQLEPVLELLLRATGRPETQKLLDLHYKLGRVAGAQGKTKTAMKHYTAVLEIDPSHMQTLVEMAALRRKSRR